MESLECRTGSKSTGWTGPGFDVCPSFGPPSPTYPSPLPSTRPVSLGSPPPSLPSQPPSSRHVPTLSVSFCSFPYTSPESGVAGVRVRGPSDKASDSVCTPGAVTPTSITTRDTPASMSVAVAGRRSPRVYQVTGSRSRPGHSCRSLLYHTPLCVSLPLYSFVPPSLYTSVCKLHSPSPVHHTFSPVGCHRGRKECKRRY